VLFGVSLSFLVAVDAMTREHAVRFEGAFVVKTGKEAASKLRSFS
jgi:hypothetical protein